MGISAGFSTALTGLKAHQTAIDVTSNNIANASNKDYVRERPIFVTSGAFHSASGDIGIGVHIERVYRITDTFLYDRFTKTSADMQNLKTKENYIKEISSYFPDVNDEGLFKDLQEFFNGWENLASNPNDSSVKVDLAYKTMALTDTIHMLRDKLLNVQKHINEEIKIKVDEANNIIERIAQLNKQITKNEADGRTMANELRDKRDALEKRLREIMNVEIFRQGEKSIDAQGEVLQDYSEKHSITLGGVSILDGPDYNKIEVVEVNGNYQIHVVNKDHTLTDVTKNVTGGEVGALLDIRGREIKEDTTPADGIVGNLLSSLDALSQGIIRSVNSLYSYSAQPSVVTDKLVKTISISPEMAKIPLSMLTDKLYNPVKNGTMTLKYYDDNGNDANIELKIDIDKNDSINDVIDKLNNEIQNAGLDDKVQAKLLNGQIKFVTVDENGNPTDHESPNLLVKDDGSLLFSALNEIEYMPLSKINTTRLPIPIEDGSFDIVVYNNDGDEIARRTITIDKTSTDPRVSTLSGIVAQINTPNIDDNDDNNTKNDVDDNYEAKLINGTFILRPKDDTLYVGLDNDSANFGGAIGINKFFDGDDSNTIKLRDNLINDPSLIHAYKAPSEGNNDVANAILQLQFDDVIFYKNGEPHTNTIYGFYKDTTSSLANEADIISTKKDATQSLLTSVSNEYYGLTGVNIDEELVNLEMFQKGYQANAKVITTINQMLDALLNIK